MDTPTGTSGLDCCANHSNCPSTLRYKVTSSFVSLLSRFRPCHGKVDAIDSQSRLRLIQLDVTALLRDGSTAIHHVAGCLFQVKLAHQVFYHLLDHRGILLESDQEVIDMRESTFHFGLREPSFLRHFLLSSYHARPASGVPLIELVATQTCPGRVL